MLRAGQLAQPHRRPADGQRLVVPPRPERRRRPISHRRDRTPWHPRTRSTGRTEWLPEPWRQRGERQRSRRKAGLPRPPPGAGEVRWINLGCWAQWAARRRASRGHGSALRTLCPGRAPAAAGRSGR